MTPYDSQTRHSRGWGSQKGGSHRACRPRAAEGRGAQRRPQRPPPPHHCRSRRPRPLPPQGCSRHRGPSRRRPRRAPRPPAGAGESGQSHRGEGKAGLDMGGRLLFKTAPPSPAWDLPPPPGGDAPKIGPSEGDSQEFSPEIHTGTYSHRNPYQDPRPGTPGPGGSSELKRSLMGG